MAGAGHVGVDAAVRAVSPAEKGRQGWAAGERWEQERGKEEREAGDRVLPATVDCLAGRATRTGDGSPTQAVCWLRATPGQQRPSKLRTAVLRFTNCACHTAQALSSHARSSASGSTMWQAAAGKAASSRNTPEPAVHHCTVAAGSKLSSAGAHRRRPFCALLTWMWLTYSASTSCI